MFRRNSTDSCLWNAASMSPGFGRFVLECLGPSVPSVLLVTLAAAADGANDTVLLLGQQKNRSGIFI